MDSDRVLVLDGKVAECDAQKSCCQFNGLFRALVYVEGDDNAKRLRRWLNEQLDWSGIV